MEIWKDIQGYEGYYQVSNLGRVKGLARTIRRSSASYRAKERIITPCKNNHGYYVVLLSKNGVHKTHAIHRLVATAYIPNPNNYPQVNHIVGNKANNTAINLEWCTCLMNVHHAIETGLVSTTKNKPSRNLKVVHLPSGIVYNSIKEAAQKLGMNYKTIHYRLRNLTNKNTIQYL